MKRKMLPSRPLWLAVGLVLIAAMPMLWSSQNVQADITFHSDMGCSYCHTPHAAAGDASQVPLWNPDHQTTSLTEFYQGSATLDATVGIVDGASKLCLSCHDGSDTNVGMGARFGDTGSGAAMGSLRNSHPVSFSYDAALFAADPELTDPSTLAAGILDGQGKMQCTSCHDVHTTAGQASNFLRWSYNPAVAYNTPAFCRRCHAAK